MWLIIIAAILIYIFRPRIRIKKVYYSKPARKDRPIAEVLDELVRRGANKATSGRSYEKEKTMYIQIKMRLLLMNDTRFRNINKAFREGFTWELPDYAFTKTPHDEAQHFYNHAYWIYNQEYMNKEKLYLLKKAGVSHVYIWPLDHRQCDAVKKIRKPKKYAIDKVPLIPCADCTEYCACSYHPAKYKD